MAKYRVKKKEIDRVINGINTKKEARIKSKIKPKKHSNLVVTSFKNGNKLAIKKQNKKLKEKAKKNLKEYKTTEADSVVNTIGTHDKTNRFFKNAKQDVKMFRKAKNFLTTKSTKPKVKIKKSNLKVKVDKNGFRTNNRKIRLKLKIKKHSFSNTKSDFFVKKNNLKISKNNVVKQKINLTKNSVNFKKVRISSKKSSLIKGKDETNVNYLEKKKKKKYSKIEREQKKVSKLDTFLKDNNTQKSGQLQIDEKSKNIYSSREKNNKFSKKAKATKQIKKKYITNKSAYKKITNKLSEQTVKATKQVSKKTFEKTAKVTSKVLVQISQTVGKAMASLLSNPYVLAIIGIILAVVIIVNVISSVFISIAGKSPNADNDTMIYLSEQLVILDNEVNEYIEKIADEEDIECDKVNYIYNSPKEFMQSSLKEFIIYLMILDNNTITNDSLDKLKDVHVKSYNIEYKIVEGIDEETGEYIQILEVSLTIYTFSEMLNILGFTEEEIERANQIIELPFNEIYKEINFNEAGKGLTQAEIDELMKDLPSSTPNREKLREIAFTLVDYTVYDWGGKASGSVVRPTGLDCSGFVAWVYDRAGFTRALQGGGTTYQWGISTSISYSQIQVGDLGFQHDPSTISNQGNNHVGMYIGNGLWIECYSSYGVGVTSGNVFKYYRKVNDFNE